MTPLAELIALQRKRKMALDDNSLPLIAHLRENGVIGNEDWNEIKIMLGDALRFLGAKSSKAAVLSLDADARNANWIKVVRIRRASGRELDAWAAIWLNRLYRDRNPAFWSRVGKLAAELNVARVAKI